MDRMQPLSRYGGMTAPFRSFLALCVQGTFSCAPASCIDRCRTSTSTLSNIPSKRRAQFSPKTPFIEASRGSALIYPRESSEPNESSAPSDLAQNSVFLKKIITYRASELCLRRELFSCQVLATEANFAVWLTNRYEIKLNPSGASQSNKRTVKTREQ